MPSASSSALAPLTRGRPKVPGHVSSAWWLKTLRLVPVEAAHFHRAAPLVLDAATTLRVGDALHLACAEAAGAKHMATLDDGLARNALRLKIKLVALRSTP